MKNMHFLSRIGAFALMLCIMGCTTPRTLLKNEKTGQTASCGGTVTGAGILYYMQKSSDGDCVADYTSQGFKRVHQTKDGDQFDN